MPAYRPKIQTEKIVTRQVKSWSSDSICKLQGCFDCTDWDLFLDSSDNIHEATDVISEYVKFCQNMIIPQKTVKVYPNNKPWVTKALKKTLNEKKHAFRTRNETEKKSVQSRLTKEIREAKKRYKEKVELQFQCGNMRNVWQGLKSLTGQLKKKNDECFLTLEEQKSMADSLNDFYCRFDNHDFTKEVELVEKELMHRVKGEHDLVLEEKQVESIFKRLNIRKAFGPDGICGMLLRCCASQLSHVFTRLFSWSLHVCTVPSLWKTSLICPVPKNRSPSSLNDYRPVALTSIVMKCFERLLFGPLLEHAGELRDPFQFAYRCNRSTDDATITLLHNAYTHLEKPNSFVRILFIDFSSAFNTIQPHLLAKKLLKLEVNPRLILWITDFLRNRVQMVRYHSVTSSTLLCSTGAPQGTVLSPVLFTFYTNDCTGNDDTLFIKYSDDTAIEDLSNSDSVYFDAVARFSAWCKDNFLELNVKKTKELVIDFRQGKSSVPDLFIEGMKVERVSEYKYLGTILDDKLNFAENTATIEKKCQTRVYLLRKLRNLQVSGKVLRMFYRCFVESVLTFSFMCWYGGLSVRNKSRLQKIVNVCGKIVGEKQESLCQLYESRVVRKAEMIGSDSSHVLAQCYEFLPSGRRLRVPKCRLVRTKSSFIPKSIQLRNK